MSIDALLHLPAFNLVKSVRNFMLLGKQSIKGFNVEQMGLYTGLQLEEMAEKIVAIRDGTISASASQELGFLIAALNSAATAFKKGHHNGDILRGNRVEMLDADFDIAWVGLGGVFSASHSPDAALEHGANSNLAKFPDNVCTKDENGKVVKPAGWQRPDFSKYVDQAPE